MPYAFIIFFFHVTNFRDDCYHYVKSYFCNFSSRSTYSSPFMTALVWEWILFFPYLSHLFMLGSIQMLKFKRTGIFFSMDDRQSILQDCGRYLIDVFLFNYQYCNWDKLSLRSREITNQKSEFSIIFQDSCFDWIFSQEKNMQKKIGNSLF